MHSGRLPANGWRRLHPCWIQPANSGFLEDWTVTKDFADFLDALNVEGARYVIIGGIAVLSLIPYRTTRDLDILIEPTQENAIKVRNAVRRWGGFEPDFAPDDFISGDVLSFGGLLRVEIHLQTPGHTMESICILMTDLGQPERPQTVFTGDTLFIGDVGRPDLSPDHTARELAVILYRSIHEKLLTLPDDTEILPAHGAGSLCGRQMSSECSSTIGKQRHTNYALLARTCEDFVHLLTDDLPPRPGYFAREVELNRRGAPPLLDLPPLTALTASEVGRLQKEGAALLDTRPVTAFAAAHVPASIHIALTGQYASWAARILGLDSCLILIGEDMEHVRESQVRLARVGVENVAGYLADGVAGWVGNGIKLEQIPQLTVQELAKLLKEAQGRVGVLDVREAGELGGGVIERSVRIPLGELQSRTGELDQEELLVVHCKGGYRSSIATSLLRRAGFRCIANLTGGFDSWKMAGLPYLIPN